MMHSSIAEGTAATPRPALSLSGVSVAIRETPLVDDVSFAVAPGEILAVVGESGCGKSITSLSIMGLLPRGARVTSGQVKLGDTDLTGLGEEALDDIRGRRISMIFQDPVASLDPLMKVGPQIAESLLVHEAAKGRSTTRKDANARALEVMKQVGIPDAPRRFNQYPFELSGGMCQRIVIAIAIVCRPEVLLADEPTTALDVTIQAQILDLLKRLRDQAGTSIVIVTHDMGVVADVADRVAVMYAGRVVESGEVHELFAHPRHPYTRMLLGTMHALEHGKPKATLSTIRGTVPPPQEWPSTCRFAGRCPVALDRCSTEPTPVFFSETSAGHSWACWNSEAAEQAT